MHISTGHMKWANGVQKRSFEKLAKHVMGHYPKDAALHKAVRGAFGSMSDAARKLKKSAAPKRKTRSRKSPARRRAHRGRTAKRHTMKRRTMKRRTMKRAARRAAPKRGRRMARRRSARRAA